MSTWKKIALWKKILIGVVIGLIIGFVSPAAAEFISPLGDIFLRMLKMLIVPLVFFSITSGICKMGDVKQLRTVGVRYVLWIVVSAVIAATCGVIAGLIVQPGKGTTEFLAAAEAAGAFEFALIHHESTDARLPGREGRPAARGPGSEDKEFGFKPDGL